ncbi:hypothetical protein CPC16_001699 [Podila verticillata]|nr:hypothetical protein BGZ52_005830 [Haplosporangium bisporale]KAF9210236.1 hypothetical protein BGZ59_009697 [Podila verticillata]KAF9393577.1 hypothetical protein CPC16_001699 [Podila verticillata]KAI9242617.1 MAG: hypothetical protein BYD32DRAFT_402887 [Podila humilis]KFH67488.1 hypothetical protein MVEG_06220 [Podila verticillata NRRL 6337]
MGNYPKAFAVGFGIVGVGYALMLTTVPTEEQLYEKLSPELKKQYHQVKADQARKEAFSDVLRRAAADPEPMWIKKTPPPPPATASKSE